jgi:hypothetical protein
VLPGTVVNQIRALVAQAKRDRVSQEDVISAVRNSWKAGA